MTKPPELPRETIPVPIVLANGSTIQGEFLVFDRNRLSRLDLAFDGRVISHTARDMFEALILIRYELDAAGIKVFCYGACADVRPSGASRSMTRGVRAARRILGQKTAEENLHILHTGPDVSPVTVTEQNQYYDEWLQSVGREKTPKLSIPVKYRRRKTMKRDWILVVAALILIGFGIAHILMKPRSTAPAPTPQRQAVPVKK